MRTIYNLVLTDDIDALAALRPDEPWLEGDGPPVILAAGRLVAKKDYPMLLRAFSQLRQKPLARLIILGKGPDLKSLQRLAADLGVNRDVRFAGWIDNVYAYMARASAFALTSRRDGLPGDLLRRRAADFTATSAVDAYLDALGFEGNPAAA